MTNLINNLVGLKECEFARAFHKSAIYGTSNIEEILKYAKNNILKKLIILAIITISVVLLFSVGGIFYVFMILPWIIIAGVIYVIFKALKKFKIF
ncbi:hypothetical protein AVANS14531_05480 [Campylobacter sp. Cr9]|uniref:hypothetical protein n=1 Tax=Campylobacter sp. Cr9 TaxID=2735728 RepID=UPI0030144E2A|nr:hypothetical protein [Campylobacter sp. Cr9]